MDIEQTQRSLAADGVVDGGDGGQVWRLESAFLPRVRGSGGDGRVRLRGVQAGHEVELPRRSSIARVRKITGMRQRRAVRGAYPVIINLSVHLFLHLFVSVSVSVCACGCVCVHVCVHVCVVV